MVHIEYIFICLAAPLLFSLLFLKGEARRVTGFMTLGMLVCLVAGFLNTALSELFPLQPLPEVYITPISEELLKALPVIVYAALFTKRPQNIVMASFAVGVGFATLENCFYITQAGAPDFFFVLIRGFAAGVMHAVCTASVGYGISFAYRKKKLALTGTFALICGAATFHAIYNLLVTQGGCAGIIGCLLPILTGLAAFILLRISKMHRLFL